MLDIVVLTEDRLIKPTEDTISSAIIEDDFLIVKLREKGLAVSKVSWSDSDFDWRSTKSVLFRTTWDYAERIEEFSRWLVRAAAKTKLINSHDLISWNMDKHYLLDLKSSGVRVVETYFVEPNDERSLQELHSKLGWDATVLKPSISATAKDTYVLSESTINQHEAIYSKLIAQESMMIQPFQKSIVDRGEISLVMIGGKFTHAVQKQAKEGDFRVQDNFGGTVKDYTPTQEEIDLAIQALEACAAVPVYARVDMVNDNHGRPAIMELELIEPEIWLRKNPSAAELLAEEICKLL